MKICIVTILIGNLSYKDTAKKNHKEYCDRHGYTYVCLEEKINDFHPMWMKPDLILRELKNGYDYVFWQDGDSFFCNMEIPLTHLIKKYEQYEQYDLLASGDENDIVNTGHLLFKNSEWSLSFINKWINFRQPLENSTYEKFKQITTHFTQFLSNNYFNDQPPVNLILAGADENKQEDWFDYFNSINLYNGNRFRKYGAEYKPVKEENMEKANSLICEKYKQHAKCLIQNDLNSYPNTYKTGDFIVHFVTHKEYIPNMLPLYMYNCNQEFDDSLYELEDCKELLKIIKNLHSKDDFSTNLEGNCMYNHFTYNKDSEKAYVRHNLYYIGKGARKGMEIGFNAGHSSMLFFNGNPDLKMKCYDMCYHKYTKACYNYLSTKYKIELVEGDSKITTFNMDREIYDFIHIDGAHNKELAFKDIVNCRQVADENTLVIIDDANYTQIIEIINFLMSCNALTEINYELYGLKLNNFHRIFKFIQ